MTGKPKKLSLYPKQLIERLGSIPDSKLANEYNLNQSTVGRLRNRLGIQSYLSTRNKKKMICPICKEKMYRYQHEIERVGRGNILFCSRECQNIWQRRNRVKVNCDNCNKEFIRNKNELKYSHHFCSSDCKYKFTRGENHPRYTGGYSSSYGYGWKRQRKLTLLRDKYCKCCGTHSNLDIHHIIPYQISNDNSLDNLITLCKSCHSTIGNMYWKLDDKSKYFELISNYE